MWQKVQLTFSSSGFTFALSIFSVLSTTISVMSVPLGISQTTKRIPDSASEAVIRMLDGSIQISRPYVRFQRDLFENYSHIPPDRLIPHILEVVRASPCALGVFINSNMQRL